MAGPIGLDDFGLLSQGTQENRHYLANVGDDVPQVRGETASSGGRILDGQGGLKTATHLHFVGWNFQDYPTNLCAVVEDLTQAGRYESGPGLYLRFG